MSQMRGLTNFISEIRGCKNKTQENNRVLRELSNIRSKFQKGTRLDSYSRRKYTWKLIYIYMLGYDIDIGHMEAMQLIASKTYAEKKTGYKACQILFHEKHDLLTMLTQPVKNDLAKDAPEPVQSLALSLISNIGSRNMADTLWKDVADLLTRGYSRSSVRKKACLCMLKMIRKAPENIEIEVIAPRVISMIADQDFGVSLCAMTLLIGLVALRPSPILNECVPATIRLLYKLVTAQPNKDGGNFSGYYYFDISSPWLQIKCLRLLQYFPEPTGDSKKRLEASLLRILKKETARIKSGALKDKSKNETNAMHGILFEAMNLIIYYEQMRGSDAGQSPFKDHLEAMNKILGRFISLKEANVRYLGLDTMTRLAGLDGIGEKISAQMTTILFSLRKDTDSSIRKRALDLLFVICNKENSRTVTQELLSFLKVADYAIREELVLKIAILAERYAEDLRWYLDVILKLITLAGDYVSDEIWYRAIHIVMNNENLQKYAATTMFRALKDESLHENGIKVGSYIMGEFSDLIAENKTGEDLFKIIHMHFETASPRTKALLLSAYAKLCNSFEEITPMVNEVFKRYAVHADVELQQRACEYGIIVSRERKLLEDVFELMPAYENAETLDKKVKMRSKKEVVERKEDNDDDDDDDDDDDASDDDSGESDSGESEDGEELDFPDQSEEHFKEILLSGKSGYLYKSDSLQIGLKMICGVSHEVKMKIFFGNKTSDDLENVNITFDCPPGVVIRKAKNEPFTVAAKSQDPQFLKVDCSRPFSEAPTMNISFTVDGDEEEFSCKLPVLVNKFFSPYECDASKFKENWGKITAEAREIIAIEDGDDLIDKVPDLFHMHKVDMKAAVCPLVGLFNVSKDGNPIKMPIMGSVAVKGSKCQVIFRSKHISVAQAALDAFKATFGS